MPASNKIRVLKLEGLVYTIDTYSIHLGNKSFRKSGDLVILSILSDVSGLCGEKSGFISRGFRICGSTSAEIWAEISEISPAGKNLEKRSWLEPQLHR